MSINQSARGHVNTNMKTPNLGERQKEEQIRGTATKLLQSYDIPTIKTNVSPHFMLFKKLKLV